MKQLITGAFLTAMLIAVVVMSVSAMIAEAVSAIFKAVGG